MGRNKKRKIKEFCLRYYIGHKGKFGHEFLEFEFRPDRKLRYANNSNYKSDMMICKEVFLTPAVLKECPRIIAESEELKIVMGNEHNSFTTSKMGSLVDVQSSKDPEGLRIFYYLVQVEVMKLAGLKSVENAHEESIWAVTWVPATDARPALLLTGSLDETVKLWRPDELVSEGTNTGHSLGVVSVAAHPSGVIAASASLDSFVRVFDVDTNATISTLEAPPSEVWNMQFDPNGTVLAVAGGGSASIKLWDTATWQMIATLAVPRPEGSKPSDKIGSGKFVLSVAWSPDGRRIACGAMDGTISVFDVARAKFLHHLEGHFMPVRSLLYSPIDPRVLFTASDDGHVHMYDAEGKSLVGAMSGHASWVLSVDASPDGAAIATGSSDRTVRLWDLGMRAAIQTMSNHTDQVWGVSFRPPGGTGVRAGRLASVSDDKSISLYDYS